MEMQPRKWIHHPIAAMSLVAHPRQMCTVKHRGGTQVQQAHRAGPGAGVHRIVIERGGIGAEADHLAIGNPILQSSSTVVR